MKQILVFAIVLFQIIISTGLSAQNVKKTTEELYEIRTINGDKYTGYINRMDDTNIIIDIKEAGLLTLKREYIKSIKKVYSDSKNNSENHLPQKYLYDKSAFPLGKGNFYYANTMLMINDFVYGITDHLTAESNINFYSLFDGGFEDVGMSFSMNYSSYLIKDKLTFLGGVRYSRLFRKRYYYDYYRHRRYYQKNILALSGILTLGDKSNNLSLGFTYPFTDNEYGMESAKLINFSGMVKVTNSTSLMLELLADAEESPLIITINARSKIKGIYLDYGIIGLVDSEFDFLFPLLSIKIPFIQTSGSY